MSLEMIGKAVEYRLDPRLVANLCRTDAKPPQECPSEIVSRKDPVDIGAGDKSVG